MIGKKVLVDTSVIIDFLRRRDKENSWLYKMARERMNIWISILTHTELYSGTSVWKSVKARQDLEKVLGGLSLIGFNEEVSRLAGKIKAKQKGELVDMVIAATAIKNKLSLATLNKRHFTGIRGLNLTSKN